jgi:hypothetical protein
LELELEDSNRRLEMTQDSYADVDKAFVETWESVVPQSIWLVKINRRGDEEAMEASGRKRFTITSLDRLITQEKIAEKKNDPFTNGQFRPVVVPEGINIETNPNALSDEDIQALFNASDVAWAEYLKVIDSADTLRRMVELADSSDISLSRFRELEHQMNEIAPLLGAPQKDEELYQKIGGPSSPANAGSTPRTPGSPKKAPSSPSSTAK